MISPNEAKNNADKVAKRIDQNNLKLLLNILNKNITKASNKGIYNINLDEVFKSNKPTEWVKNYIINELRDLGYMYQSRESGYPSTVSWN
jgi:hypothetical protein